MPKHRKPSRKSPQKTSVGAFLRRPAVQLGMVAVVALVVYLLVAASGGAGGGLSSTISVNEAYSMYQNGAFVLDVRTVDEWNEYHAPGTTLIPLDQLASRVDEVPRDRPIVVVCRSGNRSDEGRDILLDAGFTQVTSMDGGLNEWRTKGYPIEP
ncbi:MAG: rhodanese-like domain-containing protein [Anaerolineaceae bacterium]|nr:MAG: rhodanese-like domain-containing protein [Anaerolineaceae bacterium]